MSGACDFIQDVRRRSKQWIEVHARMKRGEPELFRRIERSQALISASEALLTQAERLTDYAAHRGHSGAGPAGPNVLLFEARKLPRSIKK